MYSRFWCETSSHDNGAITTSFRDISEKLRPITNTFDFEIEMHDNRVFAVPVLRNRQGYALLHQIHFASQLLKLLKN